MGTKYFSKIRAAQGATQSRSAAGLPEFDFGSLGGSRLSRLTSRALEKAMPAFLFVARELFPVMKLLGIYWITRKQDVLDVLADHDTFGVPYGREMAELAGGADFVLGVDGQPQRRQREIIDSILRREDIARLGDWAEEYARSLVEGGGGRLDTVTDFAVRIPTEICRRYFGFSFADPNAFADWSLSVSALLFADPFGDKAKRELALAGAARLRHVVDAAIANARRARLDGAGWPGGKPPLSTSGEDTLVDRLVILSERDETLHDDEIRAILLGMVVGFIPTNGLAAAKMIEAIFARPEALRLACQAAAGRDVDRMRGIVLEAGRLNPALAPGQWRYARKAATIRGRRIPEGATLMVSTMSALRDRRGCPSPGRFDIDNQCDTQLVFGEGVHRCAGQQLATEIITRMFMVLFAQPNLRAAAGRHGRMERIGYFPRRFDVEYDSFTGKQSMILLCIPVENDAVGLRELDQEIHRRLGNPAHEHVAQTLRDSGIVHFASASAVNAGEQDDGPVNLLLELNVDGPSEAALEQIARHADSWLDPLIRWIRPADGRDLARILKSHEVKLGFWPWGATGLNFFGTGDLSVADIDRADQLRRRVERELCDYLAGGSASGFGSRAMTMLSRVRARIQSDPTLGAFLVRPSRRTPPVSTWKAPRSKLAGAKELRHSKLVRAAAGLFLVHWLILAIWFGRMLGDADPEWSGWMARIVLVGALSFFATLASWIVTAGMVILAFLLKERSEPSDARLPDPARLRKITARENAPGSQQNHIIAVTPLKRGLIRRLSFAFAMWGIRQSLRWFRPGFVVTMGTIHYARWFRMPGSRKLIFQANYDGSWESYLEDFIMRAHWGQTAAWSNGEGFPRSVALINEGAKDGDNFKRWVRRQQIPTAFWYSRFPHLTTDTMRTNALIHNGLIRAHTDNAARTWLDLIGSAPRQPYELESQEIQSLVFRGLKYAFFTACIPIRLPESAAGRNRWLGRVQEHLSFGKFPGDNKALYLAFSATGLRQFSRDGSRDGAPLDLVGAFSGAFVEGMANRSAALGDSAPDDPEEKWRWQDAPRRGPGAEPVADAVLLVYAGSPDALAAEVDKQRRTLADNGGEIVHRVIRTVTLAPERPPNAQAPQDKPGLVVVTDRGQLSRGSYEHFGFRDGITTPVIRGTEQFTPRNNPDEIVEPGEFILGYRNNQDYFVPSAMVPAASDPGDHLPVAAADMAFGFPDFRGPDEQFAPRDFGRNGTFLVLRQLSQDVAGFDDFIAAQASWLNETYGSDRLKDIVGDSVTPQWVGAKMMGRWQDGRPLIGNPRQANEAGREPVNNFAYGRDDPRGHACPLGAHIRRTNPRDSLEPCDPVERIITNRHSIIRRGRTYFYDPASGDYPIEQPQGPAESGLLFAALCADLERQFEFVQQTWLASPSFHGLTNEPDPVSTRRRGGSERCFTIPTSSGPLILRDMRSFVDMRGGGYFFMPSRSAIQYLLMLGLRHAARTPPPAAGSARGPIPPASVATHRSLPRHDEVPG